MQTLSLRHLREEVSSLSPIATLGRVSGVTGGLLHISGLSDVACLGDQVEIRTAADGLVAGEAVQLDRAGIVVLPDRSISGVALGNPARLVAAPGIAPTNDWIGRIIDPYGRPLDGRPLFRGSVQRDLCNPPPPAAGRKPLGPRLETGNPAFDTFLPVVRGQRIGIFAGSGVGKTSLLGQLGRQIEADVVVFALIGERGRELRYFVETVLGQEGMERAVIVAATSDQSPLVRRKCAWTAMSVAEHFRDEGRHVLFVADSITRFAEAHREIATAAGEMPALRGYPPSLAHTIMALCERAGPGLSASGDITALFSVLVAASDMEEPVADIIRGVLDGHVVLDRKIAERGRYPAIDLLQSISRSLPEAASGDENQILASVRSMLGHFSASETLVRAGLYEPGKDPVLDQAIAVHHDTETFLSSRQPSTITTSFQALTRILQRASKIGQKARSPETPH